LSKKLVKSIIILHSFLLNVYLRPHSFIVNFLRLISWALAVVSYMGLVYSVRYTKHLHLNVLGSLLLEHSIVFLLLHLVSVGASRPLSKVTAASVHLVFSCIFVRIS